MSYVKLCQLVSQGNPNEQGIPQTVYYMEDSSGTVLVNNPTYPLSLVCEVIDWGSRANYVARGNITSFHSASVVLDSAPESIRQAVFNELVIDYPTLSI